CADGPVVEADHEIQVLRTACWNQHLRVRSSTRCSFVFHFFTPAGSTCGGEACAAEAVITTVAGSISVTLTNLLTPVQVISAGQALSGLQFTLSNGARHAWNHERLGSIGQYRGPRPSLRTQRTRGSCAMAGARPSASGRHRFFQHCR